MDVVETANFTLATHQLKLTGSWEDREALKRDSLNSLEVMFLP